MAKSHQKRILLIRNAFVFDFGGAERFPVDLATELRSYGYEPIIVSRSPRLLAYANAEHVQNLRGWWWSRQNWTGARALLFPAYLLWQLVLFVWYLQLLARLRPAIVHPQSKDDFVAATLAAKLLHKKVVWTDHADLKYVLANHAVWYKNPVGKLVYVVSKLADRITLVSGGEKMLIEQALKHRAGKKFVVIHNGVKDQRVKAIPHPGGNPVVFCATSRLVITKGIGELIEAFQEVHKLHPNTLLWLVGDGPDEQHFKTQAADDSSIVFLGHSNEPLGYVAACDVFMHPSYHEGFSLSIVEATMLSKAIIACAVGGNIEIIHDGVNGLLVPPKDIGSLHRAMIKLVDDTVVRDRLGKAARSTYTRQFDFNHIVEREFLPLYETP